MGNLVNMAKSNVTVIDNEIFHDCNIGLPGTWSVFIFMPFRADERGY